MKTVARVLLIAGAMLAFFGLMPGMPALPFFMLAGIAGAGFWRLRHE